MNEFVRPPSLNVRIPHRKWSEALAHSFALLTMASPGEVVCITGPSRVGKSSLLRELIWQLSGDADFDKTGELPVVYLEASNTGPHGVFSTKDFTDQMLQAARHPFFSLNGDDGSDYLNLMKLARTTESSLRKALERALKRRKTRFLIIDEAQHVRYVTKQSLAPCAVMDSWKGLAGRVGLVLVVVGAYPILQILGNSPHLLGRKHQIHFPRYEATNEDLMNFAKIVRTYEKILGGLAPEGSLVNNLEMLHHGTMGCIGLLRAWLTDASTLASLDETFISTELLEKTCRSDAELRVIAEEIQCGEEYLSSSAGRWFAPTEEKQQQKTKRGKPFQRNPKRYAPGNRSTVIRG